MTALRRTGGQIGDLCQCPNVSVDGGRTWRHEHINGCVYAPPSSVADTLINKVGRRLSEVDAMPDMIRPLARAAILLDLRDEVEAILLRERQSREVS